MVVIENKELRDAVEASEYSKAKAAALAGSSDVTLNKILNGHSDLRLTKVEELADFFGLDVFVTFRPKEA